MPQNIIHLRSLATGSVPTTASLGVGQFAINVPDGRVFLRKSGSAGDTIETVFTSNSNNSGNFRLTGSLNINGSISANSITGSLQGTSSYAVTASYALNGGGGGTNIDGGDPSSVYGGSTSIDAGPV